MSSDSGGMGAASSSQVQIDVGDIDANTDELEAFIGTNVPDGSVNEQLKDLKTRVGGINDEGSAQFGTQTQQLKYLAEQLLTLVTNIGSDLATETTLATRATEATLATRATETTLATRATEATLATRASSANQDTQIKRAFGDTTAGAVEYVDDTSAHAVTFHGIRVHQAATITGAGTAFTNVGNAPGDGDVLIPDYYPFAGTTFQISAGKATLVLA